ncbi:hypothetical protein [Andreprevotia chitinilytica]|uniref:hypothetical protein n=1 Tax=Andreprevotia chitinilytica TaxID=396808 RepID=UPI000ADBF6D2|nr:hypothetical protein [Andreprevotia chitinilytica]
MYILLIGYLYVVVMFAVATADPAKAVVWIVLLGALPTWLIIWIKRRGQVKRIEKRAEAAEDAAAQAAHALPPEGAVNPAAKSDSPSGQ